MVSYGQVERRMPEESKRRDATRIWEVRDRMGQRLGIASQVRGRGGSSQRARDEDRDARQRWRGMDATGATTRWSIGLSESVWIVIDNSQDCRDLAISQGRDHLIMPSKGASRWVARPHDDTLMFMRSECPDVNVPS